MDTMSKGHKYPADFVERVKREYPNAVSLHRRLDDNNYDAGLWLNRLSREGIDPIHVVEALEQGGSALDSLMRHAKTLVRRRGLYQEWDRIVR